MSTVNTPQDIVQASRVASETLDMDYTLDSKYTRFDGRIYLSGIQALVRLPLMQRQRDNLRRA